AAPRPRRGARRRVPYGAQLRQLLPRRAASAGCDRRQREGVVHQRRARDRGAGSVIRRAAQAPHRDQGRDGEEAGSAGTPGTERLVGPGTVGSSSSVEVSSTGGSTAAGGGSA